MIVIGDQQDANFGLFIYSQSTLHASGDIFAHHQEHMSVDFTINNIVAFKFCNKQASLKLIKSHVLYIYIYIYILYMYIYV